MAGCWENRDNCGSRSRENGGARDLKVGCGLEGDN